jgi:phage tail tape-measure protein
MLKKSYLQPNIFQLGKHPLVPAAVAVASAVGGLVGYAVGTKIAKAIGDDYDVKKLPSLRTIDEVEDDAESV